MPKFKFDYEIPMNNALKALGIPDAFDRDKADFSQLGVSPLGNLWIGLVLHKTFISVDELGTKAGAVTSVSIMAPTSMEVGEEPKIVRLDRPFVYAILDNATNLPIFIGTVMTL
jgi:serpin B